MDSTHAVYEVARKEVLQHIRTKRLLIIGLVIVFALALVTLVFGPRIARSFDDFGFESASSTENLLLSVFLGFLGLVFIQLLPIVLTADAVCSEWSSRTIFLLLSKPVSRTAFVLGKYLGSLFTVVVTVVVLLGLDYVAMQPLYKGSPDSKDIIGFLQFLGFLCAGCAALSAMALFFSTITRSTAIAILLTLGLWLVGFNLIGNLGNIINIGSSDPNEDLAQGFQYVNPGYDMGLGVSFLTQPQERDLIDGGGSHPEPAIALLALAAHTAVWFAGALLVVRKRNFE